MGRLTAELPGGLIHGWTGKDKAAVDKFRRRFRCRLEEHVRHDPEVQRAAQGQPLDTVVQEWIYYMLRHVLTTPWPEFAFNFRHMLVTYVLLSHRVEDPEYSGTYGDYLPHHDIEFKLAVLDEGIEVLGRIMPTASTGRTAREGGKNLMEGKA